MVDDGSSLLDPRRDGSACGTLATSPSSRFCKRHEALAQKWGEVRVLSGDDSGNAPKKRRAMMVEVLEPEAITPALVDANGDVSAMEPAGIRPPSLARLASSNLDAPQRVAPSRRLRRRQRAELGLLDRPPTKQTGAFIDRRSKVGGDGSDHDPAWITLNL
jgi:hypothetical protein